MKKLIDLKEKLEKLYGEYELNIKQGNDYSEQLVQIAREFNILIEKDRVSDYFIKNLMYTAGNIFLELVDTLKEKTYCYQYCPSAYFNVPIEEQELAYLNFKISDPKKTVSGLYDLATKEFLFKSKKVNTAITSCDYEIVLERSDSLTLNSASASEVFTIKYYSKVCNGEEELMRNTIFQREACNHKLPLNSCNYDSERVFESENWYEKSDSYTKGMANNIDDAVYKIRRFKADQNLELQGYFFENNNSSCRTVLANNIQCIPKEGTNSTILLNVVTGDNVNHAIQIQKLKEQIFIQYDIYNNIVTEKDYKPESIGTIKYHLKNLSIGKITSDEINLIIEVLPALSNNVDLISFVVDEMRVFADKLKTTEVQLDPISPRLLLQKPFKEVVNLIKNNKEEYFNYADEYLKKATMISKEGKEKVLVKDEN